MKEPGGSKETIKGPEEAPFPSIQEPPTECSAGLAVEKDPPPGCATTQVKPSRIRSNRLVSLVVFLFKFLIGTILCLNFVGSVLVMGWTQRLMRRATLKSWWSRSKAVSRGHSFASFAAGNTLLREHTYWPNWILHSLAGELLASTRKPGSQRHVATWFQALIHSLWLNLKLGIQGIFNIWVFTMPACLLWLFSWYDGWNNSFNKGYEQAVVGPAIGWLGVLLFIAAMFYVPLAHARQTATGEWRSFYQFRLIRDLIRRRWLACLGLAGLFSLLTLPTTILKFIPAYYPQINPALNHMTQAQALHVLNLHWFWSCLYVFPAFVVLRIVAARIYAGSVLDAVERGALDAEDLAPVEREALQNLGLLQVQRTMPRHPVWRILAWAGTRAGRFTAGTVTFLLWFTLVAQIYIGQFLAYHPVVGWLNQPLVQLPYFRYVPHDLSRSQAD